MMTDRQTAKQDGSDMSDGEFDRQLGALLSTPGDADTATLSRAVLSQLAKDSTSTSAPLGAVLSEPLPWGAGFLGLLLIGGVFGYLGSTWIAGDGLLTLLTLGDPLALLGGF